MIAALQPLFAFALTVALLLMLRRPAIEAGLVDRPSHRKRHGREVPLIGGICIFLGFAAANLIADFALRPFQALFAGMTILLILGVVDDLVDLKASIKLFFQLFAALLLAGWAGVTVTDLGALFGPAITLQLGAWAVPFTLFCVVGLINAVNMFDGVDGLAAGTVATALGWLSFVGLSWGGTVDWPLLCATLLAAVCGFLVFNMRNPWRRAAASFLGDSGSMLLGFALAWFAIAAAQGADAVLPPVAIGWILLLPVTDALVLMGRRIARGRNPFHADREHLHHILFRAGLSHKQTVTVLVLVSALLGGIGVGGAWLGVPEWLMLLGMVPFVTLHLFFHLRAWRVAAALRLFLRG